MIGEEIFKYVDLNDYALCNQTESNVLYTKILCLLEINSDIGISSPLAIGLALSVNIISTLLIYISFERHLDQVFKLIFILLLSAHPYLALYSLRFFTDIFGMLGIAILVYYLNFNIRYNLIYLIITSVFIHLRSALIPVFLMFSILLVNKNRKINYQNFILVSSIFIVLLSYFYYSSFAGRFIDEENSYYNNNLVINLFLLLGFREGVANNGLGSLFENNLYYGVIQLVVSLALLLIHFFGIIGYIIFAIRNNIIYISFLSYILLPIFVVAHTRYLVPVLPLILFGFVLLIQNSKSKY